MIRLWTVAIVLGVASVGTPRADGQSLASLVARRDTPHPAVCRVIALEGDGISLGSGTLVGATEQLGLVVTNWHVVRDAPQHVSVAFPDGFRSQARVLAMDRDWDLAALAIGRPNVAPVPLAGYLASRGEPLSIAGYGSGSYRLAAGQCVSYASPGGHLPYELIEVSVGARQGDSGGPIFNRHGELAGVLFGAGGGQTMGSYSGRVRAFLLPVLDDFVRLSGDPVLVAQSGGFSPTGATVSSGGTIAVAESPNAVAGLSPVTRQAGSPALAASAPGSSGVARPTGSHSNGSQRSAAPSASRSGELAALPAGPSGSGDRAVDSPTASVAGGPAALFDGAQPLNWSDLAGNTPGEQFKTVLAAIGGFALLMHVVHLMGAARDKPKKSRKRAGAA